jgi:hypothetical protein
LHCFWAVERGIELLGTSYDRFPIVGDDVLRMGQAVPQDLQLLADLLDFSFRLMTG